MTEAEIVQIVRENERMKTALRAISRYCECAIMGAWRHYVHSLSQSGLGR